MKIITKGKKKISVLLIDPSSAKPILRIIFFLKTADNHSLAGAGMDKLSIFEVDAYMRYLFAGVAAGKEYQISLTQVAAGDFMAFF